MFYLENSIKCSTYVILFMQLHTSLYVHTTILKTFPLPYSDIITYPAGCIGCIPGTCWGCCAAAAGGWWGLISWPGGIITCDTGTPGGPPLPCMATAGPGTPTQHEKGRTLLNKIHHCISGYRHFEQKKPSLLSGLSWMRMWSVYIQR